MKKNTVMKIMCALAMATFGTLGPLVRNINLSSGEIALWRAVLAVLLIGVFLLVTREKISLSEIGRELPLLFISGAAMGFNWILLFEAYNYTTVSVATLSYYFAPVIVTLACPFFFKERLSPKGLICFLASTVGIVLITGVGDLSSSGTHIIGVLLGLSAAVLYASVVLLNKSIKRTRGLSRTFIQFIAAVLVLFPYVGLTGGYNLGSLAPVGWGALLSVGLIHTGVAYCLYFSSLKELSGQEASIISYIDPLVAILVSVTVLFEEITPLQVVGGLLILGFTLYNEIGNGVKKPPRGEQEDEVKTE